MQWGMQSNSGVNPGLNFISSPAWKGIDSKWCLHEVLAFNLLSGRP